MAKVKVKINSVEGEVESGCTLLEAAEQIGAGLAHLCFGNALCSTCRVEVVSGAASLSAKEMKEKVSLNYHFSFADETRLSCQTKVMGPDPVEVRAPSLLRAIAPKDKEPATK